MAELLRGGVTTVMEIGTLGEYVVERAPHYGLRVYMGQAFRSGTVAHARRQARRVGVERGAGARGPRARHRVPPRHDGAHGDLVRCFVSPSQIDTCTPELLRDAKRFADEVQAPVPGAHLAVRRRVQRDGRPPRQDAHRLDAGAGRARVQHHPRPRHHHRRLVVDQLPGGRRAAHGGRGRSVAHAVWVFARRGVAMESFARYRAAGVNMSLGTDTNPQSVIEAMRWAAVVSKMMERNTEATTAAHAFDAATLGGARALLRDDLGRVAPGAKADLVLWKARSWRMTPLRDPVKNIVYNASDEDVDRVYVNGRLVVDGGRVLGADEDKILARAPGRRRAHVAAHDEVRLGGPRRRPALAPDLSGVGLTRRA